MSATLRFPTLAATAAAQRNWRAERSNGTHGPIAVTEAAPPPARCDAPPLQTLAFYRTHTHTLLRRYLYSSMLVGRAPSMLTEPLIRGWASTRPVETFEDCVIFVLDMEKSLARLSALDRLLITRIAIQEYTYAETALLLNRSERIISTRFAEATDRLTEILLEAGTLKLPHQRSGADDDGHGG